MQYNQPEPQLTDDRPTITLPPLIGCQFKKNSYLDHPKVIYPKGCVAVIPKPTKPGAWDALLANKAYDIRTLDEFFDRYTPEHPGKTTFTHLGAGIGDLISFSAVAAYLQDIGLNIYADPSKAAIFDWFERKPDALRMYYEPIVRTWLGKPKDITRLFMEWAAMAAINQNWYLAYFDRMGVSEISTEYCRPRLTTSPPNGDHVMPFTKGILISHRSSCQMRSGSFKDFYIAVKEVYPSHKLYVFEQDLSEADREAISSEVIVLHRMPLDEYLRALFAFDMVVTVDSAAIHFREGVQKPALAAFGAMEQESRSLHHLYTKSFNATVGCEHQPCYIHETKKGMICPKMKAMIADGYTGPTDIAPCISGEKFTEQLYEQLKQYKP